MSGSRMERSRNVDFIWEMTSGYSFSILYDAWFDSGHMGTRQSRGPSGDSCYFLREGRRRILSPEMYRKVESV